MPKFSKEQKESLLKNNAKLMREMNKIARELGIHDITISGFIVKPKGDASLALDCPCGVENFFDPRTGKVSQRCKKC